MVGSWHHRIDRIRLCYSNQASSTRSPLRLSGKANRATKVAPFCEGAGAIGRTLGSRMVLGDAIGFQNWPQEQHYKKYL
jgi:hypothetical protein